MFGIVPHMCVCVCLFPKHHRGRTGPTGPGVMGMKNSSVKWLSRYDIVVSFLLRTGRLPLIRTTGHPINRETSGREGHGPTAHAIDLRKSVQRRRCR